MLDAELWGVLSNMATVAAVIVGGWWSFRLFRQKRQLYPRAKVAHSLDGRILPDGRQHLRLSVEISNLGDVLLRLGEGRVWLSDLRPPRSDFWEALPNRTDVNVSSPKADWPLVLESEWKETKTEVEPGETETLHFDFIQPVHLEEVQVYSHLQNIKKRSGLPFRSIRTIGWNTTSTHHLTGLKVLEPTRERPKLPEREEKQGLVEDKPTRLPIADPQGPVEDKPPPPETNATSG